MQIERMKTHTDESDTNISNAPNSSDIEAFSAALTVAQGLLTAAERYQKANQKLLETMNETEERRQAADNALSAKWKTQIEAQARAIDLQTKAIAKAAQSVSASADGGARNGVNQAITEVREEALGAFNQALKPDLYELNQAVLNIQEAEKGFKKAAGYLTWKAVGLYALVAVLPLLALLGWDWHLVQKIEAERATINLLDANGGKTKLIHCGADNRLCMQIDSKADSFSIPGQEGEYRVIKGY
jgi:hypothetical protein